MKAPGKVYGFLLFSLLLILNNSSCNKTPELPAVITSEVTDITQTYASSGGTVLNDGGTEVTDSGVCWSTSENPIISDSKASCCAGTGSFIIRIKQLSADTRYYVRAYATNSAGTGYGNQVTFMTGEITLPGVITTSVTGIDLTTASAGGYIFNNGGGHISAKGVCWGKSENPTVDDFKTNDEFLSWSPERFSSILNGLTPGSKYYLRAYASNELGTSYGTQISFTTLSVNPPTFNPDKTYGTVTDIDGNIYKTIQIGILIWMAENLRTTKYNDGSSIPLVTGDNNWVNRSSAAMCWFNDDPGIYKDIYGGYYNIYAVNTKKLCPAGWHVPDKTDWSQMISYLGNEVSAGGKMKESGTLNWMSPNYGATNESGYTGLPAGCRRDKFLQRGISAYWWSATSNYIYSGTYYDSYVLDYRYKSISVVIMTYSGSGLNIRCVKD
ncbi:MAG: fibrobacter succinogenes major paralogous domain-containing protein [Bacteroidales bacterium]|nr:fibrobacter succinogenes major paralogous domain-containing protein [Bacteroidales bacterium]